jgi:putative ABC transport system substrate-binding protein
MRRRAFISFLGGTAAASPTLWPLVVRAQQSAMPVIGFLQSAPLADAGHLVAAFRLGLKETGYEEGRDVAIVFRSAENQPDRLPTLVADLLHRPVDVIVGNVIASVAAKAATTSVPIVFATGSDPIKDGLVGSFNRPGGNVTGVTFIAGVVGAKRLELLRSFVPSASPIAMLVYPNHSDTEAERGDVQAAAHAIGQQVIILDVNHARDIETAFATIVRRGAGALLVGTGAFMNSNRKQLVALAAHHAIPAIYNLREFAVAGGLMSYGASITDAYRQAGIYAGRILAGEKPGDLPVMQSTRFEFILNLKTANALGLAVPSVLLAFADEVIE